MTDTPPGARTMDEGFYKRADAIIDLANTQASGAGPGPTGASMMFAAARFNAWISATGFTSGQAMAASRQQTIDYFLEGYRQMLEMNLDQYIENFDAYMRPQAPNKG